MTGIFEITCRHCGKTVQAKQYNKMYCADCLKQRNRERTREANRRRLSRAKPKPVDPKVSYSINDVCRMARERNITYGQMVAKLKGGVAY